MCRLIKLSLHSNKSTFLTCDKNAQQKLGKNFFQEGPTYKERHLCADQPRSSKIQNIRPNHIALHVGKQAVHSAEVGALDPVFEKSAIEPKPNLLKCKHNII